MKVRGAYSWGAGLFLPPPEPPLPRPQVQELRVNKPTIPWSGPHPHPRWDMVWGPRLRLCGKPWQPQLCEEAAPEILHLLDPLQTLMSVTFLQPALGVIASTPMAPTDVSVPRGTG